MIRRLCVVVMKEAQALPTSRALAYFATARLDRLQTVRCVLPRGQTPSNRFDQRASLTSGPGSTREEVIASILESKVKASKAVVHDISGGCGSMYKIEVESPLFVGKGLVAQHRMVKDALKAEIADMHGLTLLTRAPSD